jgi:hypothetical protein
LCLQLLLRRFQFLPERRLRLLVLCEFRFQFPAVLVKLVRLLLGSFPALGLRSQRFSKLLVLPQHFQPHGLQFLDPGFELGVFFLGTLLLGV